MATTNCPSHETLRAFSVGDLGEAALESVAAHLSGCHECEESLHALDDYGDSLVAGLRHVREVGALESASVPPPLVAAACGVTETGTFTRGDNVSIDLGRRLAHKLDEGSLPSRPVRAGGGARDGIVRLRVPRPRYGAGPGPSR